MKKVKDPNRLRFKDFFGSTLLSVTDGVAAAVMTNLFMLYLTDYAGIGKWGAILGTGLLLFARIFDAVNDPLEGWIMDRAKVGKHGKYRPFLLISVLCTAIGIIGLFFLPDGLANSPVIICLWVIGFYLLYDIGASFYAPNLLFRTMTLDENERGRLLVGPRLAGMATGMVCASLLSIINAINAAVNNMHTAFGLTVLCFMGGGTLISLIGLACVKERHHAETDKEDKVKITDIFGLIRDNKALKIKLLDQLVSGFIWAFLFATMTYYMKWGYCADLTTGAVDTEKLGTLMLFGSMLMFLPLIIGTVIAGPIMKKLGSAIRLNRILKLVQGIPCLLMFVLQITGILRTSPYIMLACVGIVAVGIGMDYVPGETLNIEVMDYEIYRSGKDRSALCNACNRFLNKAQNAISSAVIGMILVAIGYEVDSVTDTFLGELSAIPQMLTWFIVVMGLIPGILGIISYCILRHYPVTDEVRADMRKKLDNK